MPHDGAIALFLGGTCIGLRCRDEAVTARMRLAYRPFLAFRRPDFWIELRLRGGLTVSQIKGLLPHLRASMKDGRLITEPRLLECWVDWPKETLMVEAEGEHSDGP